MHIIIVGAGIGGLATALSCIRRGFSVTALEQAKALQEVGAGVQISSNGTAVLRELGLLPRADSIGVKPVSFRVLSFDTGETISDMPLGPQAAERYGAPFFQFHRADLLDMLVGALPPGTVCLGSRVAGFEQDADGVTVTLQTGEDLRGDVLIGADGIHSVIRRSLVGDGETTFSGKLVWRALLDADAIADLDFEERFYGWAGRDRMVWSYWVRSGRLFNFGGVVPSSEVHRESWDETADLDELRASLVGADPLLSDLMDRIDSAFVTGLFDRDPLPRWSRGRVTLLGDSAHPMLPYLTQGACQALEDAHVLAATLARFGPARAVDALQEYENRRRPRTTKVQTTARATHIFWTEGDDLQRKARDGRMRGLAQIDPMATTIWRWLYAYDPVAAADAATVPPDKRGIRSRHPEDTPAQQKAWDMWHDLFKTDEEAGGIRGLRRGYDRFFSQFTPRPSTRLDRVDIGSASALWICPEGTGRKPVVLHLHGGGLAFGSAESSVEYGERLALAVDGRCLALDYRLSPEHPFPAALHDTVAAYRWLLDQGHAPHEIIVSGESAGGGLAVAAVMSLRDAGLPMPAGIAVLSPLADNSLSSPSIDERDGQDPIVDRDILTFMATGYFQGENPRHPLVSPIHGDFTGLPPLLIQAAAKEVLVDDAGRLADAARKGGVDVTLHLHDERLHIFAVFPFLDSATRAMEEVSSFTRATMATA